MTPSQMSVLLAVQADNKRRSDGLPSLYREAAPADSVTDLMALQSMTLT